MEMPFYDLLDVVLLEDHFLVMAVALRWCSCFNGVAHHNIDFYFFSLLGGNIEKLSVCLQEADVFLLLGLAPWEWGHLDLRLSWGLCEFFHDLVEKIMSTVYGIWSVSVNLVVVLDINAVVHENLVFLFS